ncbi:hypothetical protein MKW98_003429 [Papaver atlanticum]|uniref:Secreted protein n=1 Tax=Papaver atlanticum TaxID=357466 RepID=A0AAD4TCN7_9MAGN|nr:hypothetical protein MKW98_003429 [Papaver atlanticum]
MEIIKIVAIIQDARFVGPALCCLLLFAITVVAAAADDDDDDEGEEEEIVASLFGKFSVCSMKFTEKKNQETGFSARALACLRSRFVCLSFSTKKIYPNCRQKLGEEAQENAPSL